jgi:hypothetical protein
VDRIREDPDEARLVLDRLGEVEHQLAEITKELEAKTRKLDAAERQILDLRRLIELRKVPIAEGAPEISQYYRD